MLRDEIIGTLNTGQKECIGDIRSSGQHLLDMINSILDLSKIEAGKLELQYEKFSLEEALKEILHEVRNLLKRKISASATTFVRTFLF